MACRLQTILAKEASSIKLDVALCRSPSHTHHDWQYVPHEMDCDVMPVGIVQRVDGDTYAWLVFVPHYLSLRHLWTQLSFHVTIHRSHSVAVLALGRDKLAPKPSCKLDLRVLLGSQLLGSHIELVVMWTTKGNKKSGSDST